MKILAIDLGASYIKHSLYQGKVLNLKIEQTPKSKAALLAKLKKIILEHPADAIAFAVPGIVDQRSGKIVTLPNLKFMSGFGIIDFLKKFTKKVRVDNDVKCTLRAEMKLGAAKNVKNAFLVAIGTGIGGAIMLNRKIDYGYGAAGEIGHMVLDQGKTLENLTAGKTLRKFDKKEFKRMAEYLGQALANVQNLFDLQAIILAGGVTEKHASQFVPQMKKVLLKNLLIKSHQPKIIQSKLGQKAAAIGAALLFRP